MYVEPQMKQKVGLGKFLMELKLTTFLIYRRGSVIPMTLKERSLNIWHHKLMYLLFQPHVSWDSPVSHMPRGAHSHVEDVPKVKKAIKFQPPPPPKAQGRPWSHIVRIQSYGTILFEEFACMWRRGRQRRMCAYLRSTKPKATFWKIFGPKTIIKTKTI